jgi:NADH-quinone oxidoreductase subunit M
MIYERRHTRQIADFGGLDAVMPVFAGTFLFISLASIGLPGLNGFVGEFLVLLGSYLSLPAFAIAAAPGVVLAAVYLLWAYQRVFTGPITLEENRRLPDLGLREVALLAPIVVLVVFLGVYPKPALDRVEPAVQGILDRIEQVTDYEVPRFGEEAELAVVEVEP